jgi:hypothetical protein
MRQPGRLEERIDIERRPGLPARRGLEGISDNYGTGGEPSDLPSRRVSTAPADRGCAQWHRRALRLMSSLSTPRNLRRWGEHMLLTIAALVTLTVVVFGFRVRARRHASSADLGWMSEQWLSEHRASHLA